MLAKLLALFTIIPILELCVLIPMGQKVGLAPTLGLIVVTALAGALLGKQQGSSAWRRIKQDMERGQLPSDSLLDGLAVILASAFLVTPGVLTDAAGFILLIPLTRKPVRAYAKKRLERWLSQEQVGLFGVPFGAASPFQFDEDPYDAGYGYGASTTGGQVVIDITAQEASEPEPARSPKPEVVTLGHDPRA